MGLAPVDMPIEESGVLDVVKKWWAKYKFGKQGTDATEAAYRINNIRKALNNQILDCHYVVPYHCKELNGCRIEKNPCVLYKEYLNEGSRLGGDSELLGFAQEMQKKCLNPAYQVLGESGEFMKKYYSNVGSMVHH